MQMKLAKQADIRIVKETDVLLENAMKMLSDHDKIIQDLQERIKKLEMAYLRDYTHFGKEEGL